MRRRSVLIPAVLCLLPYLAVAQTLDPSTYTLTDTAGAKFITATQQMAASGNVPNMQGSGMDLQRVKTDIDASPDATKAIAAAGLSSTDYVLFLGAAMQSMMVGQMELAGMRGMMPPGVTKRPSQPNIDYMKNNMDLFTRAMTPGAPTAAASASSRAAAMNSPDLPVPADAASVLPSAILGQVPALRSITPTTQCGLPALQQVIDRESAKATQQQAATYGNPGDSGLARTRAEGAVLERAEDPELFSCGQIINFMTPDDAFARAESAKETELNAIVKAESEAWNACPGIAGGKDPACERAVSASSAAKYDAAARRYLDAANDSFATMISSMQTCNVQREKIVIDAKAANVIGANVKLVLVPLVSAWELPPYAVLRFSGICEDTQRYLRK